MIADLPPLGPAREAWSWGTVVLMHADCLIWCDAEDVPHHLRCAEYCARQAARAAMAAIDAESSEQPSQPALHALPPPAERQPAEHAR